MAEAMDVVIQEPLQAYDFPLEGISRWSEIDHGTAMQDLAQYPGMM